MIQQQEKTVTVLCLELETRTLFQSIAQVAFRSVSTIAHLFACKDGESCLLLMLLLLLQQLQLMSCSCKCSRRDHLSQRLIWVDGLSERYAGGNTGSSVLQPLFFWRPSAKAKVPRDACTLTLRAIRVPFDSPFGLSPPAPCCFFLFGAVELASESNISMRNYFGVNYLR